MTEPINIGTQEGSDKAYLLEHKKIEVGWLGKFFGTGENASVYIAGVVVLVFATSGISCLLFGRLSPEKFLDYSAPIISLSLGYIFGKRI